MRAGPALIIVIIAMGLKLIAMKKASKKFKRDFPEQSLIAISRWEKYSLWKLPL